jgi:hypothetical protein
MRLRLLFKYSFTLLVVAVAFFVNASAIVAQTTSFTYQGRLTDGGTAANGNYDLQFALFDSLSGGAQVGSTQTLNTVAVSNGVFTVSLDFGANSFPGASRFLEISARPTGSSFTLLTPRQQITSTPYAVRSLNASSADSVLASGVPAGSGNYIQNNTSPQASSNFNISGTGTIGGTLIAGGNVGIGTTAPTAKLSVIATGDGARVLQLGTERAWVFKQRGTGAGTALELTGDDPSNNNKHFVINTDGNLGIGAGITTPQAKLEVRGDVKLGSSGQLFAPGGEENLRIIRGNVNANGSISLGSGFTVTHTSSGDYTINFTAPFAGSPTVIATPVNRLHATISTTSTSSVRIFTSDGGSSSDDFFQFIAVGPR